MTDRELMQMALNALENEYGVSGEYRDPNEVMNALEERLAQYELDEAIRKGTKAWEGVDSTKFVEELRGEPDLATVGEVGIWGELPDHNPSKGWVGLTRDELAWLDEALNLGGRFAVIEAIEAKLKEKNT
jgi:hypothetical protein